MSIPIQETKALREKLTGETKHCMPDVGDVVRSISDSALVGILTPRAEKNERWTSVFELSNSLFSIISSNDNGYSNGQRDLSDSPGPTR